MNEESQRPSMGVQRGKLIDRKVVEIANEAVVQGMEPLLCVIILQTYKGLTIRGAGDSRVVSTDAVNVFMEKVKAFVVEYCSKLPGLEVVSGSGPS
jgi:hypothetical protein